MLCTYCTVPLRQIQSVQGVYSCSGLRRGWRRRGGDLGKSSLSVSTMLRNMGNMNLQSESNSCFYCSQKRRARPFLCTVTVQTCFVEMFEKQQNISQMVNICAI